MHLVFDNYDQTELDRQYNAQATVPDATIYFEEWRTRSEQARAQLACDANVAYGPSDAEHVDVFAGNGRRRPAAIFFHGGYWRRFGKDDFSFVATPFVEQGFNVVVVDYALAPAVSLGEIVRQCREATLWYVRNAARYDGDPHSVHLVGHSAGGQLAGMIAATDFASLGLPDPIRSVASLSGLHDLAPIALSYVNEWLALTPADVAAYSPVHHLPRSPIALLAAAGARETDEFRRQAAIYAQAWRASGGTARESYPAADNHYTIVSNLANAGSEIAQAVFATIDEAAG